MSVGFSIEVKRGSKYSLRVFTEFDEILVIAVL